MPILGGGSSVRAGTVQAWPSNTIPDGWLKCNGAAVSRALYANLFLEIQTTYGAGNGSTTFNVPDLRGQFMRGLDDGRGIDSGRLIGTLQMHQLQSHSHSVFGPERNDLIYQGEYSTNTFSISPGHNSSSGASGGTSNGSETRPRNVAMNYIIKF